MTRYLMIVFLPLVLTAPTVTAAESDETGFEDPTARLNYSLGYQIGRDIKRQGVEVDADALLKGIQDAASGTGPKMSVQDMRATLMELKRKVTANQQAKREKLKKERLAASMAFLEENKSKEGVKTTESGLQYKVIKEGSGKMPKADDSVTVHYRGRRVDGSEFDSSYSRGKPATFRLNGVIKGWTEALQLMKEGGKWEIYIPPALAYDDRGPLAHQTLIFEIELVNIGGKSSIGHPPFFPC